MKPLTLPCKKFHWKLTNLLIILSVFVGSCQWWDSDPKETVDVALEAEALTPLTIQAKDSHKPPRKLGAIDRRECANKKAAWVHLSLESPFGQRWVGLRFGPDLTQLQDQDQLMTNSSQTDPGLTERLCAKKPEVVLSSTEGQSILEALASFIPWCQLSHGLDGAIQCQLPSYDKGRLTQEAMKIHQSLVRHYRRHPYLLLRRASMIRLFGSYLQSPHKKSQEQFCRVLLHALPAEKPLAFYSKFWSDQVCLGPPEANGLALWGLASALDEMAKLQNLIAKQSRRGVLTVRIPREQTPTKDLWVSIFPKIPSKITALKGESLWLPMFDDAGVRQVVTDLLYHPPSSEHDLQLLMSDYVFSSISSETEFAITNGRGKVLRLPYGEYTYLVKGHSEDFQSLPPDAPQSRGDFSWQKGAKHPQITVW